MPHVVIEYSSNASSAAPFIDITKIAHDVMLQSGLFSQSDIKTRSYPAQDFLVGEKGNAGSFVHITVYLLEGRTTQQKQKLSETMRDTLLPYLQQVNQFSVDVRELAKDTYRKHAHA